MRKPEPALSGGANERPVLDLLSSMTAASLERSRLKPQTLVLVRLAAAAPVPSAALAGSDEPGARLGDPSKWSGMPSSGDHRAALAANPRRWPGRPTPCACGASIAMDQRKATSFTLLMAVGTFVVVMDNTIMNVSIQALVADLHTTVSGVQSAIALNALMMAAFVLFGGKLADIVGMKKTFMAGVFLYIAGSLPPSFSGNLTVFILGWCLIQGFGAALMLPNVQTIIRATLTDGALRARAYGAMAGVNALGAAMGPVIGGFLTTYFSWRWAFRLEVLALVVIVIFHAIIPADQPIVTRARVDTLGTILQAGAMIALVLGILLISDYGLLIAKQPLVVGGIELSPFNLGLSLPRRSWGWASSSCCSSCRSRRGITPRTGHPSCTWRSSRLSDFVNGLKVRSIQVSAIAGILFTVPLFMQVSFGISAFDTGLALLPLSISIILGAFLGVRLSGARLPIQIVRIGTLVLSLGAVVMVARMNTGTGPLDLALGLSVVGLGAGLIGSHIVNLVLSSVSPEETAEASGVTSTLEQLGNSVGVAILGTLLTVALSLGLSQSLAAEQRHPRRPQAPGARADRARGHRGAAPSAQTASCSSASPRVGADAELRRRSIEELAELGFDGYALGGRSASRARGCSRRPAPPPSFCPGTGPATSWGSATRKGSSR